MNVAVDVGNTFCKVAFFEENSLIRFVDALSQAEVIRLCEEMKPQFAIVSSVSLPVDDLRNALESQASQVYVLNHTLPVPIFNHYDTPHTLGTDRIAAVVGAQHLYPMDDCLVIDIGTCITYDLVDKAAHYYGGSISPGLQMRFKALHTFTTKLPLLEQLVELKGHTQIDLVGHNTRNAILSGVVNGMASELEGIIAAYQLKHPGVRVLLCGGDARFFESRIKGPIFVIDKLVLIGLNSILQYTLSR